MWVAYFQADEEMPYVVAINKFKGAAEAALERFIARMSHPEVGVWWAWVEPIVYVNPGEDGCDYSRVEVNS